MSEHAVQRVPISMYTERLLPVFISVFVVVVVTVAILKLPPLVIAITS